MNPTTSAQALSNLQAAQTQAQDPASILAAQNQSLGVGGAQSTVKGLRTSIDNTTKLLEQVAPSVMGRTSGSLVTNAQATRQVANEQAPISKNLASLGGQYTQATGDLNQLQSQAAQATQLAYQGQQDKQSYLQNIYNTMYTQEQNKLAQERQAAQDARQAAQEAEAIRQYNATLAENQRQANMSNARASSGSSSGGSSGGSSGKSSSGYTYLPSAGGGFNFFDANGKPTNAYEYSKNTGVGMAGLLGSSNDKGDKKIASDINSGMPLSQLRKKYPWAFGK